MTKSSLAHIEEVAVATLEREQNEPTLSPAALQEITSKSLHRIGGFVIRDDSVTPAALDEAKRYRTGRIDQFKKDRATLLDALEKRGIEPKAVLPTRKWNEICLESGLIRLAPDSAGEVRISLDAIPRPAYDAERVYIELVAIYFGIATMAGIISLALGSTTNAALFHAFLVGCASALVGGGIALFSNIQLGTRLGELLTIGKFAVRLALFRCQRWRRQLAKFFPDGVEAEGGWGKYTEAATLVLPQPPPSFAATLLKARGLRVRVAAESAAIGFAEHPCTIMWRAGRRDIEIARQERLQRAAREWEPIAYVEQGMATAILDQFGDFVIEKEVVERVMSTDFVP